MREPCPRTSGCAGEIGRRTDLWRDFSWHLGDSWADALCAWIDRQLDPAEAAASVFACIALVRAGGVYSTDDIKRAVADLCPGVEDALMAHRRAPARRPKAPA